MSGSEENPGVMTQAIRQIFRHIEATPEREFLLRVSYLEIYQEVITDLLNPGATNLPIREDVGRGIFVAGLAEHVVVCEDEVMDVRIADEWTRVRPAEALRAKKNTPRLASGPAEMTMANITDFFAPTPTNQSMSP